MTKPINISKECGDSLDEFIDVIVKEKWIERGKLDTAEDFYIEIKYKQLTSFPNEIYEVDFLVLKNDNKGYKDYIRHKQIFNIDKDEPEFKEILNDYIFNISDRLNRNGVIAEIEDKGIKVYSLTKAIRYNFKGKKQPYDFEKLKKMSLIK